MARQLWPEISLADIEINEINPMTPLERLKQKLAQITNPGNSKYDAVKTELIKNSLAEVKLGKLTKLKG